MRWATTTLFLMLLGVSVAACADSSGEDLNRILSDAHVRLELARSGQYGWLTRRQLQIAQAALASIEALAAGKTETDELSSDDRRKLDEARERIDRVLRADNKQRLVCRRAVYTGSRVTKTECLTVGQREERARNARQQARHLQGALCVASDTSTRCPSESGQ